MVSTSFSSTRRANILNPFFNPNPLRFYIASSLDNIEAVNRLRDELVECGYVQSYDWTEHGSVQANPESWKEVCDAEITGVFDADFLIVLLPGGRGTHVELGIALARSIPIIIVGGT